MARKKRSSSFLPWSVRFAFWILVLFSFLILIVVPAITGWLINRPEGIPTEMAGVLKYVRIAQQALLCLFIVLWVFFLGGCFASFLNVVAWRVPRGRGILGSSKCPFCNTNLPFTANLPVYGWLSSGGRCRNCKLPIALRYLIVEIILGLIFLLIVGVGLFCGGIYLPARPPEPSWGIENVMLQPKMDLLQIVGYHLFVACSLYVFALVRIEKMKIPKTVIASALIGTLGFQFLWPWVQQAQWPPNLKHDTLWNISFWTTIVMGALTGTFCGRLIWISYSNRESTLGESSRESLFGMLVVGLAFGYQFALSVLLAVLLLDALLILLGDTKGTVFWTAPIFKIGTFSLVGLLSWRATSLFPFWPGPFSDAFSLLLAIVLVLVLAFSIARFKISFHPISEQIAS